MSTCGGVLAAFILNEKLGGNVDHAIFFCRFYGSVVEVWLEIWLSEETKHPGPHSRSTRGTQNEEKVGLLTFVGTLFGDISALCPICFLYFF